MNYFFGFDIALKTPIDWMFNINHLFLMGLLVLVLFGLYFGLSAKSEKGKKITKITLAALMFIFEIGRIVYKYLGHIHNGGTAATFDWWWNISFQMCTIMTWVTILTLVLSVILKKDNKFLVILKNVLIGAAFVGGILTFAYPDFLDTSMPLLHFRNFQTLFIHIMLIFVPLYFIKNKELEVRLKNIWMPALGFLFVGCLAMSASIISGHNFAFSLKMDIFSVALSFPWHLPVTFLVIFSITTIIFSIGELRYRHVVRKNNLNTESTKLNIRNKKCYIFSIIGYVLCGLIGLGLLIWISSAIYVPDKKNWLGALCLIPFVVTLAIYLLSNYFMKKALISK